MVLPGILTIHELRQIRKETPCEIETAIFGNHGLMVVGRCSLTNDVPGQSTKMDGDGSPASDVEYVRDADGSMPSHLAGFTLDRFGPDEKAGYPTICKGRFTARHRPEGHDSFEEPVSLNLSRLLPELIDAGVHVFKIEGRQRSKSYVRGVVVAFRAAVDDIRTGRQANIADLVALTVGQKQAQGALATRKWR